MFFGCLLRAQNRRERMAKLSLEVCVRKKGEGAELQSCALDKIFSLWVGPEIFVAGPAATGKAGSLRQEKDAARERMA